MTTAARAREAERATYALQIALAKVGAATIEDALDLWQDLNPVNIAATVEAWHTEAIQLILTRRGMSHEIALAYYRLARALLTGSTIPKPGEPVKRSVTLAELRREFALLLRDTDELYTGPPTDPDTPEVRVDELVVQDEYDHLDYSEGNGDAITVDPALDIEDAIAEQEQAALEEAEEALDVLGPTNYERKTTVIDTTRPAEEVDTKRQTAFDEAGARQASAAERLAMNGGRETVVVMLNSDRKSLGFARISLTGTPCGWCGMLISRGAVYRTAGTATRGGTSKTADNVAAAEAGAYAGAFHDNCHCVTVPVFSREQLATETFSLNRELNALWNKEIRDKYSGKDAVRRFRELMNERARSAPEALEAAA
jgi:hypothetical protein